MFQQLRNIDTAFRHIRLFSIIIILVCTFICCFTVYKSYQMVTIMQDRVFILFNGKVLEAFASQRGDNIPAEAEDHVEVFHHLFFTLDPDEKMIKANMDAAFRMADESAKHQYDNLKESRYYSNLISGNISQHIKKDSIQLELDHRPFYFRYYGKQEIIRSTTIVIRSIITEGYLREVARSNGNSHGFIIERWNTLDNQDIKTINR